MAHMELDLGCGKNKHPGSIGLDMNPGVNPDVLYEVCDRKILPFANNTFDKVWAIDFIEHVEDIKWLLSEVHRVAKPDAKVELKWPHYSFKSAYSDVTHMHKGLGVRCLDHFDPSTKLGQKYIYYANFGRNFPFKIEDTKLEFSRAPLNYISRLLLFAVGESFYEGYFCNFLPIHNIEAKLRVIKE